MQNIRWMICILQSHLMELGRNDKCIYFTVMSKKQSTIQQFSKTDTIISINLCNILKRAMFGNYHAYCSSCNVGKTIIWSIVKWWWFWACYNCIFVRVCFRQQSITYLYLIPDCLTSIQWLRRLFGEFNFLSSPTLIT